MGRGDAEEADQHVADEFLDAGTMPPEHAGREIQRASDHHAQGFRIDAVADRRDGDVDEHHRHRPTLSR